ncbi:MobF family relaxase [Streptomyces sp. NPDC001889]
MTMDIELVTVGQRYRYYMRHVLAGHGPSRARGSLHEAQEEAGVPAGRWTGRGLAALGLAEGEEATEEQLRNLFGEGRHPDADRIEAEQLAAGRSPEAAERAGALGRRVKVTGADLVFRPQPSVYLMWAFGDEETQRIIEGAHEWAVGRVLVWIEDEAAVIRIGAQGVHEVRPVHGLAAARFRHYEARSGRPLLHDHLILSLRGLRPDEKWGAVHSTTLLRNTVAASALYDELVLTAVCEGLGVASEPRTVTPGRRPVMEIAGIPHELIAWTARRSDQIAACLADLEHQYVTAVDDGNPKFAPVMSERAWAKLNKMAARQTRPPKRKTARSLARLREIWRKSAVRTFGAELIDTLLERARAAAAAIRARIPAVVDLALAAVEVAAVVFVMNKDGTFQRHHLLAEARRHLALVLRGRPREPGLDDQVVETAIATHSADITDAQTLRARTPAHRQLAIPDADRQLPPDTDGAPATPRLPDQAAGEWEIPRVPLRYDRAVLAAGVVREKLRTTLTVGRGRGYDVVAHQQAAMPEQLLPPLAVEPDRDDDGQEPEAEPREAVDFTELRALRKSRTDAESLDLTAEQLRHIQEAHKRAGEQARERAAQLRRTGRRRRARGRCARTTSRRTARSSPDPERTAALPRPAQGDPVGAGAPRALGEEGAGAVCGYPPCVSVTGAVFGSVRAAVGGPAQQNQLAAGPRAGACVGAVTGACPSELRCLLPARRARHLHLQPRPFFGQPEVRQIPGAGGKRDQFRLVLPHNAEAVEGEGPVGFEAGPEQGSGVVRGNSVQRLGHLGSPCPSVG